MTCASPITLALASSDLDSEDSNSTLLNPLLRKNFLDFVSDNMEGEEESVETESNSEDDDSTSK
eukprot:10859396-Ditylum_brightwellii.AAC.1